MINKEILKKVTCPEDFCWLYAVGCLEMRLQAKTLSEEEYVYAMSFVYANTFPDPPHLVRTWFPKPFAIIEQRYGVCTLQYMRELWHNDHNGADEPTPVYLARIKVTGLVRKDSLLVHAHSVKELPGGGKIFTASNFHQYPLSFDDMVRIHGNVVAEPL